MGATQISIMPNGSPIIIQESGTVYGLRRGEWRVITGCAEQTVYGVNGDVFKLGCTKYLEIKGLPGIY